MSFLDPKEEVINIELTQHGKRLLSQGIFKPAYYAFYDDDILYDSLYYDSGSANRAEEQNEISARIKDSPQLTAHYNFSGVESSFRKFKKIKLLDDRFDMKKFSEVKDEENYLVYSLGDSISETKNLSAYNILFLNGEISGSITYLSSSVLPHVRIPQIDSDVDFKVYIGSSYEETNLQVQESFDQKVYEDGSYVAIEEDYLLLEINEENTDFLDENFDIEIFEIKTDIHDENKKTLVPLHFKTVKEEDKNILKIDNKMKTNSIELDENDVEYYFDILVDNEIEDEIICKARKEKKIKSIFEHDDRKCPDKKQLERNIYRESDDDIEECD